MQIFSVWALNPTCCYLHKPWSHCCIHRKSLLNLVNDLVVVEHWHKLHLFSFCFTIKWICWLSAWRRGPMWRLWSGHELLTVVRTSVIPGENEIQTSARHWTWDKCITLDSVKLLVHLNKHYFCRHEERNGFAWDEPLNCCCAHNAAPKFSLVDVVAS